MRLYWKASWDDGGSEVAAAVALLTLGTGKRSGSPVKEDAGGTIGSGTTCFSTATVLMACPEDRPADFFRRHRMDRRGIDPRSADATGRSDDAT